MNFDAYHRYFGGEASRNSQSGRPQQLVWQRIKQRVIWQKSMTITGKRYGVRLGRIDQHGPIDPAWGLNYG